LYKSTDGGTTWTHTEGHGFPSKDLGRIGIAISAAAPDRIYAIADAAEGGLYRSDDAGKTWNKMTGDPRIWQRGWYFGQITADPKNPDRIYAMNTIELRSDDGGKHFVPVLGDPTGDDYHELWIAPNDPDRQIMGVDQGAIITTNGGKTWSSWYNQPTAQMYHVSVDNRFPYRVYGAQQDSGAAAVPSRSAYYPTINMQQFHEVTAGGESGMIAPDPKDPDIVYGGTVEKLDLKTQQTRNVDPTLADPDIYRHTWTMPLAFNAVDHSTLYFGNQRLWQTTDGGGHWTAISPDLSRPDPGVPANLDASSIADNLGQGPRRGVVYAVGSSPLDRNLLWAGTEFGVFVSFDAGDHWHTLQQNLPHTSVRDIAVKHADLVIATHGRGFWIMDDVSALRQLAANPATWATRLYRPDVAYRVRMPMFTGTPMPKDEPLAESPPWGAYIDYSLAATPTQPIELSIYDAQGKLVRHYSSADKTPHYDLGKIKSTPEWLAHPVTLATTPGLHRFIWPVRYAPPAALAHGSAWADGVWAPPGQYTVKLKVAAGKTFSEPLTVAHDPRVTIPAEAYVQQFELARKVEADQARLAAATGEAHALHAALQKADKGAHGELAKAIGDLDAEVVAAAHIIDAPNPYNAWSMPPDNTRNFMFLDTSLTSLMQAVDGGSDAAPSADAQAGYTRLTGMLDAALQKWDALKSDQLPALNARLKAAGRPPIALKQP
jgi:photosystem II stability/assembly factor-like uncharacterized protein